jgi:hypothetical protein
MKTKNAYVIDGRLWDQALGGKEKSKTSMGSSRPD